MSSPLEIDGRGPSNNRLLVYGIIVAVVGALVATLLLIKSTGRMDPYVKVVAALQNVGDGLPQRSDVKYHGLLVGMVDRDIGDFQKATVKWAVLTSLVITAIALLTGAISFFV